MATDKECDLECPVCSTRPFSLLREPNATPDGGEAQSFGNLVVPGPDGGGLIVPEDTRDLRCPTCDNPLMRRYANA